MMTRVLALTVALAGVLALGWWLTQTDRKPLPGTPDAKVAAKAVSDAGPPPKVATNPLDTAGAIPADYPYSGPESCQPCHGEIYAKWLKTAHFRTSGKATDELVKGRFGGEKSDFPLPEGYRLKMYTREGARFQDVVHPDGHVVMTQRVDLVIGSGKLGQNTFEVVQDEVPDGFGLLAKVAAHYLTQADDWTLSPGLETVEGVLVPALVTPRCLHCHATTHDVARRAAQGMVFNAYRLNTLLLSVGCEECHGPGRAHVQHHAAHPDDKTPHQIINAAHLPRDRRMDACALCHNGGGEEVGEGVANFRPGEVLSERLIFTEKELKEATTHASQVSYLTRSKCYQQSPEMNCASCHDVHAEERGDVATFSTRCLSCHDAQQKKGATECPPETMGADGRSNCIDCHMPAQQAGNLPVKLRDDSRVEIPIRTHIIAIYPK